MEGQFCFLKKPFLAERLFDSIKAAFRMASQRKELIADLDRSPHNECLLTADGEIWIVNDAWRRFTQANGGQDSRGTNYLSICETASHDNFARRASQAIFVAADRIGAAPIEYPCHSPTDEAWYRMTAEPKIVGNTALVHVRHQLLPNFQKPSMATPS